MVLIVVLVAYLVMFVMLPVMAVLVEASSVALNALLPVDFTSR